MSQGLKYLGVPALWDIKWNGRMIHVAPKLFCLVLRWNGKFNTGSIEHLGFLYEI